MKKSLFVVAVMIVSVSLLLTVGAERAGAQGPAGAGASTAAKGSSNSSGSKSSHSLNPIKWVKKDKDSKNSVDSNGSRSDTEKKLTPKLQAQGGVQFHSYPTDSRAASTATHALLAPLHTRNTHGQ